MICRILAAVAALTIASPAMAEMHCGEPDAVLKGMKDKYGEVPAFVGMTANGLPATLLVSPSGSWTMLMEVQGKLCFLGAGQAIGKNV